MRQRLNRSIWLPAILAAAITLVAFGGYYALARMGENTLLRELAAFKSEIEASDPHAKIEYSEPRISGGTMLIDRFDYQIRPLASNGPDARPSTLRFRDIALRADKRAATSLTIGEIHITDPQGATILAYALEARDIEPSPTPIGRFDRFSIGYLAAGDVQISGSYQESDISLLSAKRLVIEDFARRELGRLELEGLHIGNENMIGLQTDRLVINQINYQELFEIMDNLDKGLLPLDALSRVSLGRIDLSPLHLGFPPEAGGAPHSLALDEASIARFFLSLDGERMDERLFSPHF